MNSTWKWTPSVKIFVSHADAHHKASTTKVVLDNQVDKMTWPSDVSQTSYANLGLA